jgi:hypothetical protein
MKGIREGLGPVYTKNKLFRDDFWLVVNGMLSEEEFDREVCMAILIFYLAAGTSHGGREV